MNSLEADDTYAQDNLFAEIKTEVEELLKIITGQSMFSELKEQVETMYQSLESSYSNVNIVQRQLVDVKTKLK